MTYLNLYMDFQLKEIYDKLEDYTKIFIYNL